MLSMAKEHWPRSTACGPCMLPGASKQSVEHMHQAPTAVKTLLVSNCSNWRGAYAQQDNRLKGHFISAADDRVSRCGQLPLVCPACSIGHPNCFPDSSCMGQYWPQTGGHSHASRKHCRQRDLHALESMAWAAVQRVAGASIMQLTPGTMNLKAARLRISTD